MGVWHIFLCQNSNSLNGKSCRRIYRSLWTEENFVMSIILPITLPHISIPRQTACLITINILSHAWIKTWYKNLGGHRKRDARRNVGTGLLRGEATPVRHPPVPCPPSRCCRFPRPERRRRGNRGAEEPRGGGAERAGPGRALPGTAELAVPAAPALLTAHTSLPSQQSCFNGLVWKGGFTLYKRWMQAFTN